MIRRILFVTLLSSFLSAFAQEYKISGTIAGLENENLYLLRLMGEKRSVVDTAQTDLTGSFTYVMPDNREVGMYVIVKGPGRAVELIYNKENIQFTTSGFDNEDGIQIISSIENLIYYDYLAIKGMNMYKIEVLGNLIHNYPPNDEFFLDAIKQYNLLKDQLNTRTDVLIENNPLTLAARYLKADRPLIVDPTLPEYEKGLYLKKHYFDNVDFSDTMLIKSTFLTSKAVGYLSLFQNDANSQEELEDFMLMGIDTIFKHAQVNQQVYEFLVDFLISGFQSIGFEKGLEHIANASTLDQFCENTERKLKLENKLELIKKLAIGQPAPDFTTTDIDGNVVILKDIKAKKTVLLFWASWCPHCDEIMPVINSYYGDKSNLEVIAISIDESKDDLLKSLKDTGYDWINVAELKGWNGDIINEYGIVATPSVFILDENKKIIGKPLGKEEIAGFLK